MTFSGLKQGQDVKNRAAHPHQEFPGVPIPGFGCFEELQDEKERHQNVKI